MPGAVLEIGSRPPEGREDLPEALRNVADQRMRLAIV